MSLIRGFRFSALILAVSAIALTSILVADVMFDERIVEEADGIRNVEAFITMTASGSNQRGNVVKLYTGTDSSRSSDQFFGNLTIYRTAKALQDRISINLYFTSDDPSLVMGAVSPIVTEVSATTGVNWHYIPIVASIRLTNPMLDYSTGLNPMVKVKVWGTWMSQWNIGQDGSWESGIIDDFYIYVHIVPYHYLQMSFDPAMVELSPGGSGEIEVIVMNTGNGMERVDLSIPNEKSYAKEGWIFEFNQTSLNVGPRDEARVTIKVTAPRSTIRWRMETVDFGIRAISYYDRYQAVDEGREDIQTYEMPFAVYIYGLDFTYVPWAWAGVFYVLLFIILLNAGIWPFTMRKRKLPRGKEPGFVALYRYTQSPARRAKVKARREEKRRLKKAERERKKEVKDLKREMDARNKSTPPMEVVAREKPRAKVLDLKRVDDDFDIDLPEVKRQEPRPTRISASKPASDDDFDIRIDEPVRKAPSSLRRPLFSMKQRKPSKVDSRSEEDLKDVLDDL